METQTPQVTAQAGQKTYISLPPEVIEETPFFSFRFVAFAVVVCSIATVAGLVTSGRISVAQFQHGAKPGPVAAVAAIVAHVAAPAATPAPELKGDAFVVTSISLGQPSFAIINGAARQVGDVLDAPGASGWKVRRIDESTVWLQNGATVSPVQISTPGVNALNDTLHPLN